MHEALSIADGEPLGIDPVLLSTLLTDYGHVLRKSHHAREARPIEARAAGLQANAPRTLVVDVTELGMKAASLRK
jgi:hypothetical protein